MIPDPLRQSAVAGVVERILEAHGGERWQQVQTVEMGLSSGGLAFATKFQARALSQIEATVARDGQAVELRGSKPRPWGVRFGDGGRRGDAPLAEHLAALRRGRRRLAWSVTDVATFAAAALWTYVHVPFVLAEPAIEVKVLGPWREAGQTWMRLGVRFPEGIVTHSPCQVLYVDDEHCVRRHDYTACAFGRWARAAQYLSDYRNFDGLCLPTRRRVHARLPGGRRIEWPQLVWIDVHEVTLR